MRKNNCSKISKHSRIFILLLTVALLTNMLLPTAIVRAEDNKKSKERSYAYQIEHELNAFAQENDLPITFDSAEVEIKNDYDFEKNYQKDLQTIKNELLAIKTSLMVKKNIDSNNKFISSGNGNVVGTNGLSYNASKRIYTAKVENMIPSIGWGYINQDFRANVNNGKISSISLIGSSYDTGITLAGWTPNYSWYEISKNRKYSQIRMKGKVNYLLKSWNLGFAATFLSTQKAEGNKLVDATYLDYPDS